MTDLSRDEIGRAEQFLDTHRMVGIVTFVAVVLTTDTLRLAHRMAGCGP